jgi:hypothetical protein
MEANRTVDPKSIPYLLEVLFESYSDKCGYKSYVVSQEAKIHNILADPVSRCLKQPGPIDCNVDDCPFTVINK